MNIERDVLIAPPEFQSKEVGSFFEQLEDQNRRLAADTRGLTPVELEWQAAPGMNAIGMLLAHIAIVEVYWVQVGPLRRTERNLLDFSVLGIGADDDGMPLPAGGRPPTTLAGKDLGFYDDLLARARAHTREKLLGLQDRDLDHEVERRRRDGTHDVQNIRWILYHMVEHEAGHYYQINLLRHLQQVAPK